MTPARSGGGSLRHRSLLVLLILTWAVSWPVIKVGVTYIPPLWYACLRYQIAAVCLFTLVVIRGEFVFPPRPDWPLVAVSGALQMGAYSALTGLALTVLPPGRASVLAFSTPIWVVPLAAWQLNEHLSWRAMAGVGLGLLGVFAIAAPSLHAHGSDHEMAYAMLLGAAAAWAVTIVFVRSHRFTASALALAPWQMLVAAALLVPVAMMVEGRPAPIGASGFASLAYVGPIATAFSYWAVVETGRHLRASTMSMALLATPSLGILISTLTLGETVGASLIAGVVLIGTGIRLATMTPKDEPEQDEPGILQVHEMTRRDSVSLESSGRVATASWALAIRAIVGYGFIAHGLAKLSRGPDAFAAILQALGVPAPHLMAWATILIELLGGLAVLLGAFVWMAAVPLATVLVVAMLAVHLPYGFSSIKLVAVTKDGAQFGPPGYEIDLLYIACLAALALGGPGPLSIDGVIARRAYLSRRVER